ncbi:hypothetical protein AOLI_G00000330 [Acnodon oligacanthus]
MNGEEPSENTEQRGDEADNLLKCSGTGEWHESALGPESGLVDLLQTAVDSSPTWSSGRAQEKGHTRLYRNLMVGKDALNQDKPSGTATSSLRPG